MASPTILGHRLSFADVLVFEKIERNCEGARFFIYPGRTILCSDYGPFTAN